jgi:arylsulfatase A-like enzyme
MGDTNAHIDFAELDKKPNILWICTDSQRYDTLGCYGNPFVRTPNIDKLAERGVLFENVFSQNPLCTPSRVSFLTGRYPITTGLRQNGQNVKPTEKLVTRLLADEGYVCGLSGKLHLSACDHRLANFREAGAWKGKDENYYFRGVEQRIDDGYSEFHWDHHPGHPSPSSGYTRWLQDRGQTYSTPRRDDSSFVLHGMPDEHHQTTFCIEKAIGFIKAYKGSPYPWLFSINMFAPHFPFNPPDEFFERYLPFLDDIPLPSCREGELDGKPPYQKKFAYEGPFAPDKMTGRDHRMVKAAYWAMVDHIDHQVGHLLQALEESGQADNTIVIFTSDHGELLGDHSIYKKGPFMYDGAMKVPLIISYPAAIEGGRRSSALVELADLAPTILDMAGLPRYPAMQTRSIWPYMLQQGELGAFRDDIYSEFYNSNPNDPKQYCTMVRTDRYKLVAWHGQQLGELYDLEADSRELNNLWDSPGHAAVKCAMLQRLCDRMAMTTDPLPHRLGYF